MFSFLPQVINTMIINHLLHINLLQIKSFHSLFFFKSQFLAKQCERGLAEESLVLSILHLREVGF